MHLLVKFFGQLSGSTDHDMLYWNYGVSLPKLASDTYTYRDFRHSDQNNLIHDACSLHWDYIRSTVRVDEQIGIFNALLTGLFDKHVPPITFRPRLDFIPYYSSEVSAAKKCKRHGSDAARLGYVRLRNTVTLLIRQAKRAYYCIQLDPRLPSKYFWGNAKQLGLHEKSWERRQLWPKYQPGRVKSSFPKTYF